MIKKNKNKAYGVDAHLEHWVGKSTYADRLLWLEEANQFVGKLKRKKKYPDLSSHKE